mmetsp:Transcript_2815/g.7891  ORF Transcript_2815/g.7891 Transcript_2815/m.7891 type:complete len:388 (-) Transcript_2815:351-1514(-)
MVVMVEGTVAARGGVAAVERVQRRRVDVVVGASHGCAVGRCCVLPVHAAGKGAQVDRHACLRSALEGALEHDGIVVGLFRDGVVLGDLVQVRLVLRVGGLLLGDAGALHHLAEMGQTSQEHLVVVRVPVASLGDAAEAPAVGLADEGGELGVLEVGRDDADFELARLEDPPRSAVRHPSDDVGEVRAAEDGVHLGHEVGDATRLGEGGQGVRVLVRRKVPVVEVRVRLKGLVGAVGVLLAVVAGGRHGGLGDCGGCCGTGSSSDDASGSLVRGDGAGGCVGRSCGLVVVVLLLLLLNGLRHLGLVRWRHSVVHHAHLGWWRLVHHGGGRGARVRRRLIVASSLGACEGGGAFRVAVAVGVGGVGGEGSHGRCGGVLLDAVGVVVHRR